MLSSYVTSEIHLLTYVSIWVNSVHPAQKDIGQHSLLKRVFNTFHRRKKLSRPTFVGIGALKCKHLKINK